MTRRSFLARTAVGTAGAAALALSGIVPGAGRAMGQGVTLRALVPRPPDPAPPGVPGAAYSGDVLAAFEGWQREHGVTVEYEALPWSQLHDRIEEGLASGDAPDVLYMAGWAPEFAGHLLPFADVLPPDLLADLPGHSFRTVTWDGRRLGVVFTLSLLTTFFDRATFEAQGIGTPPRDWAELLGIARQLTGADRYGWVQDYGTLAGIGSVASYWMVFLQQAGGRLWDESGRSDFDDEAGIDALQLMVDLMPYTDPGALTYPGIDAATGAFAAGRAAMMLNWPFMRPVLDAPSGSRIAGGVGMAVNPAGPAGSASIDAGDAYTIAARSARPDLARALVEAYLSPEVQRSQALDTGWLPIRLSVLADPELQARMPAAAALLEQARHPFDSFVTPDYDEVTTAISTRIQQALAGTLTPAEAIRTASDEVSAIVARRP
jgi:multiple sugar transport system substrate-binding protein